MNGNLIIVTVHGFVSENGGEYVFAIDYDSDGNFLGFRCGNNGIMLYSSNDHPEHKNVDTILL